MNFNVIKMNHSEACGINFQQLAKYTSVLNMQTTMLVKTFAMWSVLQICDNILTVENIKLIQIKTNLKFCFIYHKLYFHLHN